MLQYKYLIALLIICFVQARAQYNNANFGLSGNYIYTTTAKYYPYPNAASFAEESYTLDMEDITSYAFELRYRLSESIFLGAYAEYIEAEFLNTTKLLIGQNYEDAAVLDKFTVIPIELNLYYVLPFSGSKFKFLMEGGVAYYYGTFDRELGNASIANVKKDFAYGIQTGVSTEYLLTDFLIFQFKMKFRDPEIEIDSKYSSTLVNVGGREAVIPRESFSSKLNIDGVAFIFGILTQF